MSLHGSRLPSLKDKHIALDAKKEAEKKALELEKVDSKVEEKKLKGNK